LAIPIISDILQGIQWLISNALSLLQSLIQSAPPVFKIIFFIFLALFLGGVVTNFALGTYYTCYQGYLFTPNNIFDMFTIKYHQIISTDENKTNYCAGDLQSSYCSNYNTKTQCDCLCTNKWSGSNETGDYCGGILNWADYKCKDLSESCCSKVANGCYWVSTTTQTPFYITLQTSAEMQEIDKNGFNVGCKGDNVSLFIGTLDLFGYETIIALVILSIFLSMASLLFK
jgi:hypothetical protein